MLSPTEAERIILPLMPRQPTEECRLDAAHGRVLREDVRSERDLPPYDRVMMDGYALRAAVLATGRREFRIEGLVAAGAKRATLKLPEENCVEVATGAILPKGADCVVPYEAVRREGNGIVIVGYGGGLGVGHAIHSRGSDRRKDEVVIETGSRLNSREIAAAAGCGRAILKVSRIPRIAVVATGDELVGLEDSAAEHEVRRTNDYALRAALLMAGYPHVTTFHLRDESVEMKNGVRDILSDCDVAVFTGGISKGRFDLLAGILAQEGVEEILRGVAQKPGKPMWFGKKGEKNAVFALPGNPVSAYLCFHRYVLPALAQAMGEKERPRQWVSLAKEVTFSPPLTLLLPVKIVCSRNGDRRALPQATNTSGDYLGLLNSDGFVELPAEQSRFPEGSAAAFWPW